MTPYSSDQWLAVVDQIYQAGNQFLSIHDDDIHEIWLGPPEYALMQATLREYGLKSQIEHFLPHDYPKLIRFNRPVSEYAFRGYAIRRMVEPGVRVGVTCATPAPATR
jgi:hypothetical protein